MCTAETEVRREGSSTETHFLVRHLEHLLAGSKYPEIGDKVAKIVTRIREQRDASIKVFVDATGFGPPLLDVMESRIDGAEITPAYFTYGDRLDSDSHEVKIGKAFLVSRLQVLLQTGCLHFPQTDETDAPVQELLAFQVKIDPDVNDRYGAFKVGTRDELVTALGLAVHADRSGPLGGAIWAPPGW